MLCGPQLIGQRIDYVPGQLIVQLGADVDAKEWGQDQDAVDRFKALGETTNIFLLSFDHAFFRASELMDELRADPRVRLVQRNHPIAPRRTPNDTRYDEQWEFNNVGQLNGLVGADINIEPAWDVTTGGVTANGDTIVVAILDDGTDLDHEDLVDNLWRNHDEIPGNNIDDDNNGYVDDVFGFDTQDNDGDPEATQSHGTPPAGIIGATGNNELGVAGMNWNIKLMTVRNGFLTSEAEVIQAYGYVLDARREYEESDGARGAYVVATNASWGRNFGNVADSPIWCSLYDDLGAAGILNAGAVANLNINVDVRGDLPTNCPSEFLIGVTNLDTRGRLVSSAGFGAVSVDLGAHGQDVFTTTLGNGYGRYGGTSSATPHVTGALALLYAAPCEAFGELLRADPTEAARYVRRILLETTRFNSELDGKTASNGQLDVGAAMSRLMMDCDECFAPSSFSVRPVAGSAVQLLVDFRTIDRIDATTLRYRAVGTSGWNSITNPELPLMIGGLEVCTAYEFELQSSCGSEMLPVQQLMTNTDGCCEIPDDLLILPGSSGTTFSALFTPILAGTFYRLRYRVLGDTTWLTRSSNNNRISVGGALPCTAYEFEFRTECSGEATEFGARQIITSRGCGACLEEEYCQPAGYTNDEEWIKLVNIGNDLVVRSGRDRGAFGDNTGEDVTLVQGGVYPVRLEPGIASSSSLEEFRIYVDWNQNGQFTTDEIIGTEVSRDGEAVVINLIVPDDAPTLSTRMRVLMNFIRIAGGACTSGRQGEIEDYCLDVRAAEGCSPPIRLNATFDEETGSTNLSWRASAAVGNDYQLRYRLQGSADAWTTLDVTGIIFSVSDLNLCGAYEVELASICSGTPGEFQRFTFGDTCVDTDDQDVPAAAWSIAPNPANSVLQLKFAGAMQPERLRIYTVAGQLVREFRAPQAESWLALTDLPAGLYLVELLTGAGQRGVKKLIIQ